MYSLRFRKNAFSLVEVTLALGISSVAILAMLALMPVGLSTMKDAAESAGRAQVLTYVASTLRATPFGELTGYVNGTGPMRFDRVGRPWDSHSGSPATFAATLTISSAAPYPGAPAEVSQSALPVTVRIDLLNPNDLGQSLASEQSLIIIPKS
jgi:uncharacterized protein (TIGR02598 family)